jgi:hypothetical protein
MTTLDVIRLVLNQGGSHTRIHRAGGPTTTSNATNGADRVRTAAPTPMDTAAIKSRIEAGDRMMDPGFPGSLEEVQAVPEAKDREPKPTGA